MERQWETVCGLSMVTSFISMSGPSLDILQLQRQITRKWYKIEPVLYLQRKTDKKGYGW